MVDPCCADGHPIGMGFLDRGWTAGGSNGAGTVAIIAGRSDTVVPGVRIELLLVTTHGVSRTRRFVGTN